MSERRNWTVEEVRQALALYLRLSFGQLHKGNHEVIALAVRLGRSPSAAALKLANLAGLDQSLPRKGMANASATDRKVWAEFIKYPELVLAAAGDFSDQLAQSATGFAEQRVSFEAKQNEEIRRDTVVRRGQAFFRKMILTSYQGKCALTGNDDARLLNASHIIGWAENPEHRLNPSNGICLNALHDRAFDRHLITFDEDYQMVIAPDVPKQAKRQLDRVETRRLSMPTRFLPDQNFLEYHRREFFERAA